MSQKIFGNILPERILPSNITTLVGWTILAAVVINIIIKITAAIVKMRHLRAALKDINGPPPHWLYGNINQSSRRRVLRTSLELAKKYGPVYKLFLGPLTVIVGLASPEYIKAVMNTADPKDAFYSLLNPWIGDGLLLSSGKKWVRNRRLLTPAFHFDILKPYQRLFSESAMVLVEKWKKMLAEKPYQSIEMFEHVSLFTLDSLMKCIFSHESNFQTEGKKNPYIKAVYELSDILITRARSPIHHNDWVFYFSYLGYKLRKAVKVAQSYSKKVIQIKRKEKTDAGLSVDGSKRYLDFLDMLLACRDEDGNGLTDQEIQDEVDTFMFEGHDTTASGISWCLFNMACNKQYQEKCRNEINQKLGDKNEVTWENTSELPYLTMCIKESLRMHPPVTRTGRQLTKPLTLPNGQVLPTGTIVSLNINTCHYNPDVWPNPMKFDPERFNPENSMNRDTHAFIPFSAGPRNCIGQHFAMNEMKTTIALLLKHFVFSTDDVPIRQPDLVLRAKDGIWLKVKPL